MLSNVVFPYPLGAASPTIDPECAVTSVALNKGVRPIFTFSRTIWSAGLFSDVSSVFPFQSHLLLRARCENRHVPVNEMSNVGA